MKMQCGKILGFIGEDIVLCVDDDQHHGDCHASRKLMLAAIEWLPRPQEQT